METADGALTLFFRQPVVWPHTAHCQRRLHCPVSKPEHSGMKIIAVEKDNLRQIQL
jgi:hypothetical protein